MNIKYILIPSLFLFFNLNANNNFEKYSPKYKLPQKKIKEQTLKLPDILNPEIKNNKKEKLLSTFVRKGPTIQIAILLDTSNSMDGLLSQAKKQIWKIINEISKANKNNKEVIIEVAIFEYGKSSIPREEGYIKMHTPLTSDLDKVSEKLFDLYTQGGEEYAGMVIKEATNRLQWSKNENDLKLILIAGNESFNQGNIDYKYAVNKAKKNKIIINTIFCGNYDKGINLKWKEAAKLGNGKYMNISQNEEILYIKTPYDEKINNLSKQLNKTYFGYSKKAKIAKKRMLVQDTMAEKLNTLVERNIVKASSQYDTSQWDVLSKYEKNKDKTIKEIKKIKKIETKEEEEKLKKELEEKLKKQKELKKEINKLKLKREEYLNNNDKTSEKKDFGTVIIKNIKEILKSNNFNIK
jgi:hypothetical protein